MTMILVTMLGCGDDDGSTDSGAVPDSSTLVDSSIPVDSGGSSIASVVCAPLIDSVQTCEGATLTTAQCNTIFSQAASRGCQASYLSAFRDFISGGGGFECDPNVGTVPSVTDNQSIILGMFCPLTVADPDCYGLTCENSVDCSSTELCNDATGGCFTTAAACPGLPCENNVECPRDWSCNDSIATCIPN